MELIVDELGVTPLRQEICLEELETRWPIKGIKPHLYMHNSPAGTFHFKILDSGFTELASKDFTSAEIKSDMNTTDGYIHLWKAIIFDVTVPLNRGTYYLELSASGYTYTTSSHIAWVREFESIYNKYKTSAPQLDWDQPYGYYLFTEQKGMFL